MIKDLHIFEVKTDAIATNRGFYYQYLKTLIAWLDIYLNNFDSEIYCETDDDIKKVSFDGSIEFNQIKCYSSSFSLKTEEIKKSLYNFFILYSKNINVSTKFIFETNSEIKKSDELLELWNNKQFKLSKEDLFKLNPVIENILTDFFKDKKDKKIIEINQKISKLETTKNTFRNKSKKEDKNNQIEILEKDKSDIISNYDENILFLKNNLDKFIQKIGWFFSNISPENSIAILKQESILNINKISNLTLSEKLIFHRLLSEIYDKSSQTNIHNRKLNKNILLEILKETEIDMESKINSKILDIFNDHEKRITKLENQKKVIGISKVNFDSLEDRSLSYFEGKSAKPQDIKQGLSVRREKWEKEILEYLKTYNVVVIKSSSGQGKSTLAWQTSFSLTEKNWDCYEIYSCNETNTLDLKQYIEEIYQENKNILIIIDGLRKDVNNWHNLVSLTSNLSTKFLITTREDDWYRYNDNNSNFLVKIIDISIDSNEAKDIYNKFKISNKLHNSISNWEEPWEKIKDSKLLIEFVFLLTQGKLIEERLLEQINQIKKENDSKTKFELLKLISVANLCNIELSLNKLVDYFEEKNSTTDDIGDILKSLKQEYYIDSTKKGYFTGLHQVRSEHIKNILHESYPLSKTLLNLLEIIEEDYLYDFSSQAPLLLEDFDNNNFIEKFAEKISKKSYLEITNSIDGLFTTEVYKHWKINKDIYDSLFKDGLLLFGINSFIWNQYNFLNEIQKIEVFDNNRLEDLKSNFIDKIIQFEPEKSLTFIFCKNIVSILNKENILRENLISLSKLFFWLKRFNIENKLLNIIDENTLLNSLNNIPLKESGNLFLFCYRSKKEVYDKFLNIYTKEKLISFIKKETNIIKIYEENLNLNIEYLLVDKNIINEIDLNSESVKRIDFIYPFFPNYEKYSTKCLNSKIPNLEDTFEYYFDPSIKSLSKEIYEGAFDKFNAFVNSIWSDSISFNYNYSIYNWQKCIYEIRKKSLNLVYLVNKIFESIIENSSIEYISSEIDKIRPLLLTLLTVPRNINKKENLFFNKEIKIINEWLDFWKNFINQFIWFFTNKEKSHLPNHNIQNVRQKLLLMQNSYNFVLNNTFSYFKTTDIELEECIWYNRLASTIAFYKLDPYFRTKRKSKKIISEWWNNLDNSRIEKIRFCINNILSDSNNFLLENNINKLDIVFPTKTIESESIITCVIGIKSISINDLVKEKISIFILGIFLELSKLSIDITEFILVFIDDNNFVNSLGLNSWKAKLDEFNNLLNENIQPIEKQIKYLFQPKFIAEEYLSALEGNYILIKQDENLELANIINILFLLRDLSIVRESLDKKSEIELKMLNELELDYKSKIHNSLIKINIKSLPIKISEKFQTLESISEEEFKNFYYQINLNRRI